jgi:integrase
LTLERTRDGWSVQLRYGKARRKRFAMPRLDADPKRDESAARERQDQLTRLASLLVNGGFDAEKILEAVAAQVTAKDFASAVRAAHDVATGKVVVTAEQKARTFRDVAELWLSGELHRKYPDVVKGKAEHSVRQSRGILEAIYPHLDKDVTAITRADLVRAKADATPQGVSQAQRAHYARHIRIVMSLAVNPLELIEQSPVPPKFVPPYGPRRALGFLYPEEDALLLGASEAVVPYAYRLYYGFLARNGCRPSEGLRLVFGDLDLRRGILTLDKNKTKVPRAWVMGSDVTRVLSQEREKRDATDADLVFPGVEYDDLAERFREHLWDAGVQRRELHAVTSERRPIRVHDLRGSFVTIALSHGANEDWVMRRTGHTTSAMLGKYRRQIEHAREIDLGWYGDFGKALSGELRAGIEGVARGVARKVKTSVEMPGFQTSTWSYESLSATSPEPKTPANPIAPPVSDPATIPGVARSVPGGGTELGETPAVSSGADTDPGATPDPVEKALAFAITEATKKGRFDVVLACTNELAARRRLKAAEPPSELERARAKREKGEGK